MNNKFFEYRGQLYPGYLKRGHAADFIIPFAEQFCKGRGLDIGGLAECHFPGAMVINKAFADEFDALHLPRDKYDYIFSSHTLEHIFECREALRYWKEHLKKEGVLFLYLPHQDMLYWRPENCKKHIHSFSPYSITTLLENTGFDVKSCSRRDLFWSFAVVATNRG